MQSLFLNIANPIFHFYNSDIPPFFPSFVKIFTISNRWKRFFAAVVEKMECTCSQCLVYIGICHVQKCIYKIQMTLGETQYDISKWNLIWRFKVIAHGICKTEHCNFSFWYCKSNFSFYNQYLPCFSTLLWICERCQIDEHTVGCPHFCTCSQYLVDNDKCDISFCRTWHWISKIQHCINNIKVKKSFT